MRRPIVLVDLEGVLFPELWPALAAEIGQECLSITTREVPDYEALMMHRLAILKSCAVTLADVQEIAAKQVSLRGAREFIEGLQRSYEVAIVTDSFAPMNASALESIGVERVFTNHFAVDRDGYAAECFYWHLGRGKERVFDFLPSDQKTFAIGDGLNDLGMLRKADLGMLFDPSDITRSAGKDLIVFSELDQVVRYFEQSQLQNASLELFRFLRKHTRH